MGIWDWLTGSDGDADPTVTNVSSPEQSQMWAMMKPTMQNIFNRPEGTRLWDIPDAPSAVPYMQNADPSSLAPTGNWYNNLDPNIRQGIEQPFNRGADMLGEQLGGFGGSSQRGGVSGNMAAGLGNYWANAAPQMATQGWNMMQPSLQAGYNQNYQTGMADYGSAMDQWSSGITEGAYPYTTAPSLLGGTYSTPVVQQNSNQGWMGQAGNWLGLGLGAQQLFGGS